MENNQGNAQANVQGAAQAPTTNANVQTTQNSNVGGNTQNNVNYDEIFKKLDSILEKRSDGIAKSALKDNGYEDAEMKDILTQYRASKQAKATEADTTITTLQNENAQLKATIQQKDLNNEALTQARSLNVDDKTIPYLIKMADLSNCIDDKGVVSADNVKKALETVLNDVPSLKQADKGTAGVQVGANTSTSTNASGNMFGFNFTGVRKHD